MNFIINILTISYLFLFSLYHIITGIVSVIFPNFALRFYKVLYGFHPKETEQLKITLRPWGNFAIAIGIIGFIILYDIERFFIILFPFALLLTIRIFYRFNLRNQLYRDLKVTEVQNWRMIIIQFIGVILFIWMAFSMLK